MKVSSKERESGRFEEGRFQQAIDHFKRHGFVVFEGLFSPSQIEALRREYQEAFSAKLARSRIEPRPYFSNGETRGGGNHTFNRWNMHLPSRSPFLDPGLIAHPLALGVLEAILGDDLILQLLASDTPLPKAADQHAHQDDAWPTITANVLLVDSTDENGPTELWPGTHQDAEAAARGAFSLRRHELTSTECARVREQVKPERLIYPAGTMILRDQRALHRGTANLSSETRPMLTFVYRPPPSAVPYRAVGNAVAAAIQAVRHRFSQGPKGEPVNQRALAAMNAAGMDVEVALATDRWACRPIPADVWRGLPARAQRLLRFAQIEGAEGPVQPDYARSESALRSLLLLAIPVRMALCAIDEGSHRAHVWFDRIVAQPVDRDWRAARPGPSCGAAPPMRRAEPSPARSQDVVNGIQ